MTAWLLGRRGDTARRLPNRAQILPANFLSGIEIAAWAEAPGLAAARRRARRQDQPLPILHHGLLSAPLLPGQADAVLLSVGCLRIETSSGPQPGWAETALATEMEPALLARARAGMTALVAARVGGPIGMTADDVTGGPRPLLLAADRPVGSHTPLSDVPLAETERMLAQALALRAATDIALLLPAHRRFHALARHARALGCAVAIGHTDPWPWIEAAGAVHCLGGDIGLLGLILGRPVTAHAAGAYTGRGLTVDAFEAAPRAPLSLEAVFAGICLAGTRYLDPFRGIETSFEATIELLASWRRVFDENAEISACLGISFWKRERIGAFFATPGRPTSFAKTPEEALARAKDTGGKVAFWPLSSLIDFPTRAQAQGVGYRRVEDGFIRSIGLGTNLMPPASIVADSSGIYFDPNGPSDLETILAKTDFSDTLRRRARDLIRLQIDRGITKYNLARTADDLAKPPGRRAILVPGQVEDDKSVLLGGAGITSNAALLARVRAANPDAFIVYKGHPDVEAGHRKGLVPRQILADLADAVLPAASIVSLINWADEIHTLTSLSGFEALLRGRKVVTYGQPFYAGWGLTQDMGPPIARRGRALTIEDLVAGVLILYPRYIDPVTRLPCGPEVLIERIAQPELWPLSPLMRLRHVQGWVLRRFGLSGSVGKSFK